MTQNSIDVSLASFWVPEFLPVSAWTTHAPFAFWLIDRLRPSRYVELGTHHGYSFFAVCQAIQRLELGTAAFAIDTWLGDEHAGHYGEEVFATVSEHNKRYLSFSTLMRSTFDDALAYFEDGSIDLLHIDGSHHYDEVKHDYETWKPKLTGDAVVLFHDTNVRERDFGVWRLFKELGQSHPSFQFLHGHGLGIVCPGGAVPAPLLELMRDDAEVVKETRLAYAALGASVARISAASAAERVSADALRHAMANGESQLVAAREAERVLSETIVAAREREQAGRVDHEAQISLCILALSPDPAICTEAKKKCRIQTKS